MRELTTSFRFTSGTVSFQNPHCTQTFKSLTLFVHHGLTRYIHVCMWRRCLLESSCLFSSNVANTMWMRLWALGLVCDWWLEKGRCRCLGRHTRFSVIHSKGMPMTGLGNRVYPRASFSTLLLPFLLTSYHVKKLLGRKIEYYMLFKWQFWCGVKVCYGEQLWLLCYFSVWIKVHQFSSYGRKAQKQRLEVEAQKINVLFVDGSNSCGNGNSLHGVGHIVNKIVALT